MATGVLGTGRCRWARNHGPFPYIQSEASWQALPDTSAKRVARPRTCPPPPDQAEVQALLRHQLEVELQQASQGRSRSPRKEQDIAQRLSNQGEDDEDLKQPSRDPLSSPLWAAGLSPWDRLYTHHTLNSVRRHAQLKRIYEAKDQLDLALRSIYQHDHSTIWSQARDIYKQPETVGLPTWKVLRNTRCVRQVSAPDHPVRYGGVTARPSVHSVKLAISGNHMSQTNAGFSRKEDGTFYS